jgi:hypothetical protein
MDKKKKPETFDKENIEKETKIENPTRVTQVVEVIEIEKTEEISPEPSEKITHSQHEPKSTAITQESQTADEAQEEEEIGKENAASEIPKTDTTDKPEDAESKPKQVVEELFSKPSTDGIMEISINRRKSRPKLMLWAIVVVVAAIVVGISLITFSTRKSASQSGSSQTKPTPQTSVAPSPTTAPITLNREDITIQVLNGGGVAGAATKMKNLLTDKGYKVEGVGNTSEYNYEQTEIKVKADKEGALNLLKKDLSGSYTISSSSSSTLSADSEYDAQVVVGKE